MGLQLKNERSSRKAGEASNAHHHRNSSFVKYFPRVFPYCLIRNTAPCMIFYMIIYSGWWFGTCFIFPYIGNSHPNWHSYFSDGWLNHQPDWVIPHLIPNVSLNWLVQGKNYRKILYFMGQSMVSCRFSLKSTHWTSDAVCLLRVFLRRAWDGHLLFL